MKKGELEKNKDRFEAFCACIRSNGYILCRLLLPPDEYASYREDEIVEDKVALPCAPTVVQGDKSKWSLYMHPKDDTEVNYNISYTRLNYLGVEILTL